MRVSARTADGFRVDHADLLGARSVVVDLPHAVADGEPVKLEIALVDGTPMVRGEGSLVRSWQTLVHGLRGLVKLSRVDRATKGLLDELLAAGIIAATPSCAEPTADPSMEAGRRVSVPVAPPPPQPDGVTAALPSEFGEDVLALPRPGSPAAAEMPRARASGSPRRRANHEYARTHADPSPALPHGLGAMQEPATDDDLAKSPSEPEELSFPPLALPPASPFGRGRNKGQK